jgi:hypothetical protein
MFLHRRDRHDAAVRVRILLLKADTVRSSLAKEYSFVAIVKGSASISSLQPPVITRCASAARVCRRAHFPTCRGRESAARRATRGEV